MKLRIAMACLLLGLNATTRADDWEFIVAPYALFPYMQGQTAIRDLPPVDVDEDPDDIFSNLKIGAMLYAEARNEHFAITSDILYMDLEADVLQKFTILDGEAQMSQLGWELAFLGRISPWIELGVSALYMDIEAELDISVNTALGTVRRTGKLSHAWVDPTVLARATIPIGDKWFMTGRLNIGGFGVSSDSLYQVQGDIGYRFTDLFLMTVGYRILSMDYERGSGADRFVYDMDISGPMVRLGFTF